jgi:hypothetical protein
VKEILFGSDRDFGEWQVVRGEYDYHQWLQGILGRRATVYYYHGFWKRWDHWKLNVEHICRKRVEMKR